MGKGRLAIIVSYHNDLKKKTIASIWNPDEKIIESKPASQIPKHAGFRPAAYPPKGIFNMCTIIYHYNLVLKRTYEPCLGES